MNQELSRREFLRRLTVLGAGPVLLPLFGQEAVGAVPTFVPAGKVADFVPGLFQAVTLPGGTPIQIRRLPGKTPRFQVLSARCTHKGCLVSWHVADKQFRCPCHGGRFDANGKNIGGPPPSPLPALPIKVVKGVVLVGA